MNSATATARPRVRLTTAVAILTAVAALGWIATAEATNLKHERAAMIVGFVSGAIISVASWISRRYAEHLAAIAAELVANNERWERRQAEAKAEAYVAGWLDHMQGGPPAERF